jgi:hypothetical protein
MGTGTSFRGIKQLRREADHSTPSTAEVKNGAGRFPPPHICLHDIVLLNKLSRETSLPLEINARLGYVLNITSTPVTPSLFMIDLHTRRILIRNYINYTTVTTQLNNT